MQSIAYTQIQVDRANLGMEFLIALVALLFVLGGFFVYLTGLSCTDLQFHALAQILLPMHASLDGNKDGEACNNLRKR